jgi:hypothetical protein
MRYLTLMIDAEANSAAPGTPEWDAEMEGFIRFGELAGDAILGGEALQPAATAVTIRSGAGDQPPLMTAGPFAETAEVVGGFYVLEAEDLDAAVDLARALPPALTGAVEVRPMVDWFDEGGDPGTAERPRHLALIYGEETAAEQPGTPEWDAGAAEHARFHERHGALVRGGASLHPVATATTVRVRDGEVLVTDGPFAEVAEVIGGLYLLGPATREDAVEVARRIPVNPGGAVELRPIMEIDG